MKRKWGQGNIKNLIVMFIVYVIVYRFQSSFKWAPGSSANFCTYTLVKEETGIILHMEHINKTEVFNKSPNMQREALRRSLEYMSCTNPVATDASTSIISMMGECSLEH